MFWWDRMDQHGRFFHLQVQWNRIILAKYIGKDRKKNLVFVNYPSIKIQIKCYSNDMQKIVLVF